MVIPKNRIRLSRALRSQITPYPNAGKLAKVVAFLAIILIIAGVYSFTRQKNQSDTEKPPKQILGEQEQAAPLPQFDTYRVKQGDTLFNLSQKFGVAWQTLAEINELAEPYVLRIGQQIKIPASE